MPLPTRMVAHKYMYLAMNTDGGVNEEAKMMSKEPKIHMYIHIISEDV